MPKHKADGAQQSLFEKKIPVISRSNVNRNTNNIAQYGRGTSRDKTSAFVPRP